jgi:DNA-binding winged helix-turn-helix (wHTH) protein
MQLLLASPRPRREPIDHDGSPIVEHRANPAATEATLEFGHFRVLPRQRRLLAGGVPVDLGARAFDILMVLIEADGALVTRNELQSRVWSDIVVAQDNLKTQIFALRKALGEDRELIRTEHGRGYRFTAAVRAVAAPECSRASGATTPQNRWNATSPTELSVIASRLTDLEDRLAEVLNLRQTHPNRSRSRRRRCSLRSYRRRTWRCGPIGSRSRDLALHEKLLDLAC